VGVRLDRRIDWKGLVRGFGLAFESTGCPYLEHQAPTWLLPVRLIRVPRRRALNLRAIPMHIFLSIVFALLALNLIGFVFTICGFDLGWPFLLGGHEASRSKEHLGRRN